MNIGGGVFYITKRILTEDTPIILTWLTEIKTSKARYSQLLPNDEDYPYQSKMISCANVQAQREIRLYANLGGLTPEQVQKMNDLMDVSKGSRSNIKVIDFNAEFKDKYDLRFLENEIIPSIWKVGMMNLIALIEDGPAIYFDFDTLPQKEKIEKIAMNEMGYQLGYGLSGNFDDLEDSIIAVSSKNHSILSAIYNVMGYLINYYDTYRYVLVNQYDRDLVRKLHCAAATLMHNVKLECCDLDRNELEQKLKDYFVRGEEINSIDSSKRNQYFMYEGSCYFGKSFSWIKNLDYSYQQKELDLASNRNAEDNPKKGSILRPSSKSLENKESEASADKNEETIPNASVDNDNVLLDKTIQKSVINQKKDEAHLSSTILENKIIQDVDLNGKGKSKKYCSNLKEAETVKKKLITPFATEKVLIGFSALFTIAFAVLLAVWCMDKFPHDKKGNTILLGVGIVTVGLIALSVFCFCYRNKSKISSKVQNNGVPEKLVVEEKVTK